MLSHLKIKFPLLSLLLILFHSSLASEIQEHNSSSTNTFKVLNIVTPVWKNFTEADGSGFYFELMRLIYEPLNISIEFKITPWARSLLMVQHKQADALLGSYLTQPNRYHYPKKPIWLDVSAVAFKRYKAKWVGSSNLENKKVGWIRGYDYDDFINANMTKIELIDNNQAWKLLSLDRIDFYIDIITDLTLFMKENNLSKDLYKIEKVLTQEMFVKFSLTPKGKEFADIFDQRIVELLHNGQLQELYTKWDYYPDHYQSYLNAVQQDQLKQKEPSL